jgi:ABC-type uncharacterized transport system permease subunit
MEILSRSTQTILPFLYGALLFLFASVLFRKSAGRKFLYPLLLVTIAVHGVYIFSFTLAAGHCLYTNYNEFFSLIAFTLLCSYTAVEPRRKGLAAGTGMMVVLAGCIFQTLSSLYTSLEHRSDSQHLFESPTFNLHIITIVFGFSAFTLATIYGSLYLLLYRAMRMNEFGSFFHEVPSLDKLERYGVRSSMIGFVFLTISIIAGAILTSEIIPVKSITAYLLDSKTLTTILIWTVFGVTLLLHEYKKIGGRKIVIFWMSGFALSIISMTIINRFVSNFHNFF